MTSLNIDLGDKSSQLKTICLNRDQKKLFVVFHSSPSTCYEYPDVTAETFRDVVCANSIGSAFDKLVKKASPTGLHTRHFNPPAWPAEVRIQPVPHAQCVSIVLKKSGEQYVVPSTLLQTFLDGTPLPRSAEAKSRSPRIKIDPAQSAYAW